MDNIFLFDGVDGESLKVDIGNATCEGEVYTVTPLVNATKLMKNTVKGYGNLVIELPRRVQERANEHSIQYAD